MKRAFLLPVLALLAGPALAQSNDSLVVLFLSQPGVRPAQIFSDGFESGDVSRWDADGDEQPDLILRRDDAQGNLIDILVINPASLDTLWRVVDVGTTLGITSNMDLWGFADPFGTGTPQAVFAGNQDLRLYNPKEVSVDHYWSWSETSSGAMRFLGAADFRGTGADNLIVYLPDTKQVQIWGTR